ncbi:hypothetical protein C922_00142 [Plasmodium inui San Antonio 1]|uniref:Uncharacterized protein n=1 Tax=Plasmodium inui San Antonio 1 TaxID=1237626 RepID=W7AKB8_9APIC|nr:hypothetical protein C922_00142 [Plasmodium inui San Antonio 1]EUD69279.1 hypothetical protein C922_00142 [Plasmodium inui San Antonio 1]
MRIANVQKSGKTYVQLVIARLYRDKGAAAEYPLTGWLRKNGKRNYSIARHEQSASGGSKKEDRTSCADHEKHIKDAFIHTVNRSLSEKTKQQTNLHSPTDACEEVREKRIRESLKKYNLFNVYLDKIEKAARQNKRKQKIININSVKHYDEYVHMFDIDSLLTYANSKFKIFKNKRKFPGNKDFFSHFLKILIQLNGKGKIRKEGEPNAFPNVDHHKLFYEYMTGNYDEDTDKEKFDAQNDISFVKSLNIFGDKLEEITSVDDAESFFFHKNWPINKGSAGSAYPEGEENVDSSPHLINEDLRNFPTSSIAPSNYSHVGVNAPHGEIIATNKFNFLSDEPVHAELNNHRSFEYLTFAKAFVHLLKNLIKHLHDDGVVRLFIHCSSMFDSEWDDKEVLSFYTEMYKRIHKMKNISNKNIAYILSSCSNYCLREENTLLLKKIKRDILLNSTYAKAGTRRYLNIYNVTPSHLENIIYTFSKHRFREKNLFALFSEIVKEKFHGFSCITTINILKSYTILNYESLVFDFLYVKIKSFDFLSFTMCRGKNVIKLMNTLLLIEHRNCSSVAGAEKVTFTTGKDGSAKRSALLTDEGVYTALLSALLYELKTFKGEGTDGSDVRGGSGGGGRNDQRDRSSNVTHRTCAPTGEHAILSIYKKLLRLQIIGIQNKSDLAFLKSILKRTYGKLHVDQLDDYFVFSFINMNLNKINFHKLVFTLLTYNNLIEGNRLLNNYTQTKKKFI